MVEEAVAIAGGTKGGGSCVLGLGRIGVRQAMAVVEGGEEFRRRTWRRARTLGFR